MNKKYRKNIEKQKDIQKKIEELKLKQEMLKEEQEEMENIEVLKELIRCLFSASSSIIGFLLEAGIRASMIRSRLLEAAPFD